MVVCFACGAELAPSLEEAGRLRCRDCRGADDSLRGRVVQLERRRRERPVPRRRADGPPLTLIRTLPVHPTSTYDPPPLAA